MKALLLIPTAFALATLASCTALTPTNRNLDADADTLLKTMSHKLAAAQQLSFTEVRSIDASLVEGTQVAEKATVKIQVARPNRFRADVRGTGANRQFLYDGTQVVVSDRGPANAYAKVPAPKTIDKMVDQLESDWGISLPLADLIVADPYGGLTQNTTSAKIVGTERVSGTSCDHIACTQEGLEWEIWIAKSDSLPRKFVITLSDRPGKPQVAATLSDWNLNATFSADHFVPVLGKGATEIEMIPR